MTHTTTWQTKTGKAATLTVSLQATKVVSADGQLVEVECCEMRTEATVDGKRVGTYVDASLYAERALAKAGSDAVALCGKLAIPQSQYDSYLAAKATIEATPIWQAKVAKEARAEAEAEAYEQHVQRVEDAMTLNGRSY